MKKVISIVIAGLLLFANCYAMVEYSIEEYELIASSKLYENADFLKNTIYFGDNDGYITSINGEQYYVNRSINYYGYQKVYSLEVFNYFKSIFDTVFQYEKVNNGYIVCTPAYRMLMQNYMWNGEGKKAYLYDYNLNLINEADFSGDEYSGRVYSVDYFKGNYIVQLVHGGNQKSNDPISYSYYQSNDFTNWTECEKLNKISNYKIIYENGIASLERSITGAFFTAYNGNTGKAYISNTGIYTLEIPKLNGNDLNWEDNDYLYFLSNQRCIKISKHSLSEQFKDIENAPQIVLNDTLLAFEQPPVTESDRILVPMRFLFEQMGATVEWNHVNQTATAIKGDKVVSFSIDNTSATVNNSMKTMDVPARLVNDKTMIPLRFLSEELGYKVEWDEKTKVATIKEDASK